MSNHKEVDVNGSTLYTGEIKRFITYYSTCQFHQKLISDESKMMKDRLNSLYQELLMTVRENDSHNTCQQLQSTLATIFSAIFDNIRQEGVLSNIWKAALKTLIKLLSYQAIQNALSAQREVFDLNSAIEFIILAKIDPIDHSEEEQKLLLKQKILIKIVKSLKDIVQQDSKMKVLKYLLSVVKKQTVDDLDSYYSLQFGDATKSNLHKLINELMMLSDNESRSHVIEILSHKIEKCLKILATDPTKLKEPKSTIKIKEYLCFIIKSLEDSLKKHNQADLIITLQNKKDKVIQILCQTSELEDIMVKCQSQQLFTFLLTQIINHELPLREQLEIMLVKIVLKPAILLLQKIAKKDQLTPNKSAEASQQKQNSLAGAAAASGQIIESDEENDDFIQVLPERSQQDEILIEMSMNFVLETLMLFNSEQIAKLYLYYDCQPFSESIISKSIMMLLKYYQGKPEQYFKVFNYLSKLMVSKKQQVQLQSYGGMGSIFLMLEQKQQVKKYAKELNLKFKNFLNQVDEHYSYIDADAPANVAAKMLAYSREVQISKVIEVIGGKDDRAKRIMDAYLEKMDFRDGSIEHSMRRFLQTFRLAGVDSQVVNRIVEKFGHKFFEKDIKGLFANKEECHDFAYLIIVLQTSQHNPNIKSKIDKKSFIEQALMNCPKSKETLPADFFDTLYQSVTDVSFFTPISRSLIEEGYNIYNQTEVGIRLSSSTDIQREITEEEFVNSADLTKNQLFHYSNTLKAPSTLIPLAQLHLSTLLSTRLIKYLQTKSVDNIEPLQKLDTIKTLIEINKQHQNFDMIDKLFALLYKSVMLSGHKQSQQLSHNIETLLWENFDCLKKSMILLPKLQKSMFLRSDQSVLDTLQNSLLAVRRLINLKYSDKTQERLSIGSSSSIGSQSGTNAGQGAAVKQKSFFDLVYNYFTEAADEEDQSEIDKKNQNKELSCLADIRKDLIAQEEREGDYQQKIDEKYEDAIIEQWSKQKQRLQELIGTLCFQIKDNLNQEDGILCLTFLLHIINKSEHSVEILEKLWFELHLILNQSLKSKSSLEPPSLSSTQSSGDKIETGSNKGPEYEVISNDTSVDSIDTQNLGDLLGDILTKESDPIKLKINEAINRHLILQIHLQLGKELLNKKQQNPGFHIIKEVQKVMSQYIEESDIVVDGGYRLFDEIFMFDIVQGFIKDQQDILKSYPKLPKFMRLCTLLVLKSQKRKLDLNDENQDYAHAMTLIQKQVHFFSQISITISELSQQLPLDLITLCVEVFSKIKNVTMIKQKSARSQKFIEDSIKIIDNLNQALHKQQDISSEVRQDIWMKIIVCIQEKLLLNSCTHAFGGLTNQVFNLVKIIILSHPFDIKSENFTVIKKLFSELLQKQTFTQLQEVVKSSLIEEQKSENVNKEGEDRSDSDEADSSDVNFKLEQISMIAVNNLSDIFIYYISAIFQNRSEQTEEPRQQIFAYLWLSLLKQLLDFSERAHNIELHGLVVCSHDNIKRVVEFLIQQEILLPDNSALWNKSWETIGAFFRDMKDQVVTSNTIKEESIEKVSDLK